MFWFKNFGDFYWILIGCFNKLSFQTFQPLVIIYRRGNFVYQHLVCTSIYRTLSYPFRSLDNKRQIQFLFQVKLVAQGDQNPPDTVTGSVKAGCLTSKLWNSRIFEWLIPFVDFIFYVMLISIKTTFFIGCYELTTSICICLLNPFVIWNWREVSIQKKV